jgi:hypothetical protein
MSVIPASRAERNKDDDFWYWTGTYCQRCALKVYGVKHADGTHDTLCGCERLAAASQPE